MNFNDKFDILLEIRLSGVAEQEYDVLTLGPNVATTCYGMNDGGYSPMTARGLCKKPAHFGAPEWSDNQVFLIRQNI